MKLLKYTVIHSTYSMKSDKTHGFIELTFNNFFSYLFRQLGMAQHYELGEYIRKRYENFLNESYKHEQVSWEANSGNLAL